jgi:flagellar biosynthesis/type III secretory pathway M-ring protein FliF/YscJ
MVIRGPLGIIIGLIVTLIIVFVVVLPQLNRSNELVDQGMQMQSQAMDQAQQQLDQAQEQMDDAFGEDQADEPSGDSAATAKELGKCVSDAGTDVEALSACQEQFAP